MPRKESPSQTAGPYVHIGCTPSAVGIKGVYPADLGTTAPVPEERKIRVEGKIFDGNGEVVRDAMLELWQASDRLWQRCATDPETGFYTFDTAMPNDVAMPFLNLWIVARGINLGLHTRIYFPDNAENEADPVLIGAGARRETLIAKRPDAEEDERDVGMPVYRFDLYLQGERETVFLDV